MALKAELLAITTHEVAQETERALRRLEMEHQKAIRERSERDRDPQEITARMSMAAAFTSMGKTLRDQVEKGKAARDAARAKHPWRYRAAFALRTSLKPVRVVVGLALMTFAMTGVLASGLWDTARRLGYGFARGPRQLTTYMRLGVNEVHVERRLEQVVHALATMEATMSTMREHHEHAQRGGGRDAASSN